MKILSWNINGIKTSLPFVGKLLAREDPDVLFLSEIKVGERALAKLDQSVIPPTYTTFWNPCKKAGSHGTAMMVKTVHEPVLVTKGLARPKDVGSVCLGSRLVCGAPRLPGRRHLGKARRGRGATCLPFTSKGQRGVVVVGTYVPNVGEPPALPRLGYRVRQWDPDLAVALQSYMDVYGGQAGVVWRFKRRPPPH